MQGLYSSDRDGEREVTGSIRPYTTASYATPSLRVQVTGPISVTSAKGVQNTTHEMGAFSVNPTQGQIVTLSSTPRENLFVNLLDDLNGRYYFRRKSL